MVIYSISSVIIQNSPEEYFVDANILYFLYSESTDIQNKERVEAYSKFINKLKTDGNRLFVSSLNLQEVLHIIERKEHHNYCKNCKRVNLKTYRKNASERQKIKLKLFKAVRQINSIYSIIEDPVICNDIKSFIQTFDSHSFDPVDFLAIRAKWIRAESTGKNFNYITDDSDFKNNSDFRNMPYLNIFTYET